MINTILSVMVIAAVALIGGAIYLLRRGGARKQPLLMLLLAAILFANVAILAIPNERGLSPANNDVDTPADAQPGQ
ncbi:hypothetical protein [Sphingorhabdus sp. Alg239-R122]|uniref:hypothetical protein n=1 Tax=Sphingorhabdus sp. Alg239-R122 TaxID=2305989 RepID=UPI0013D9BE98|nr:hypothetical protein [Sphingorhabdus sp. Alg239-R122]